MTPSPDRLSAALIDRYRIERDVVQSSRAAPRPAARPVAQAHRKL